MNNTRSQSVGKTLEVSHIDIGWLAGILDGEGCIELHKHLNRLIPRVSIVNTDFAIVERYVNVLHSLNIGCHVEHTQSRKYNVNAQDRKMVVTSGFKRCRALIEFVEPHLTGSKRYRAMSVLSFIYSRLMKPGGGRGGNRSNGEGDYDLRELYLIERVRNDFKGNLNEYTQEWIDDVHKMYSELHRQYAEAAEMTARLREKV